MNKYIIFDASGAFCEYNAENVFDAIDSYIKYDISKFKISIATWNKIKGTHFTCEDRIKLCNELVLNNSDKIIRVIGKYDYIYGDEIAPQESWEI